MESGMSLSFNRNERRAQWLMRVYPRTWRERYGDEFAELLISEFEETPKSWRRTINVVVTGCLTRLVPTGLAGQGLQPIEQVRASVVSLGCALGAFLAFGFAMWSQLTIGWQWSRPDTMGTTTAMVVMSVTAVIFCALGLLAALPIAWAVLTRFVRRQGRLLLRPSLVFVMGVTLLIIGARHFGNGWPGTGGHRWSDQGIVPGGMASFTWASTLSVSSYWVHPRALSSFPATELAWMAISPIAIVCVVVGAASTVRRLELSAPLLRYEARLGSLASYAMIAFLTGCCFWIIDGGTGPRDLFHIGAINVIEAVMMGLAIVVARRAVHRSVDTRCPLPAG
jgi:hypothetical protein